MLLKIILSVIIVQQCSAKKSHGHKSQDYYNVGVNGGCPNYGAACGINWEDKSSCAGAALKCDDNEYCYIECADIGGCTGATIYPPSNAVMDLSCQNTDACRDVTIQCPDDNCNIWLHCDPGNPKVCSKSNACAGVTINWSNGKNECDCLGDCLNNGGNSDGNYENCPNWNSAFVFHHEEASNASNRNVYGVISIIAICALIAIIVIGCICYRRKKKKKGDVIVEIGDESEEEGNEEETETIEVEVEIEVEENEMLN